MPFLASWRPYMRRFSVFTRFSKLIGSDARRMPILRNVKLRKNVKTRKREKMRGFGADFEARRKLSKIRNGFEFRIYFGFQIF